MLIQTSLSCICTITSPDPIGTILFFSIKRVYIAKAMRKVAAMVFWPRTSRYMRFMTLVVVCLDVQNVSLCITVLLFSAVGHISPTPAAVLPFTSPEVHSSAGASAGGVSSA